MSWYLFFSTTDVSVFVLHSEIACGPQRKKGDGPSKKKKKKKLTKKQKTKHNVKVNIIVDLVWRR